MASATTVLRRLVGQLNRKIRGLDRDVAELDRFDYTISGTPAVDDRITSMSYEFEHNEFTRVLSGQNVRRPVSSSAVARVARDRAFSERDEFIRLAGVPPPVAYRRSATMPLIPEAVTPEMPPVGMAELPDLPEPLPDAPSRADRFNLILMKKKD